MDEAIADGEGSAFLEFMAPLAYADLSGMSSTQRGYYDRMQATESAHATGLGGSGKQGDLAREQALSRRQGAAWPNPVTDVVHVRVPEETVGEAVVFDMAGRQIAHLSFQTTGADQTVTWDLRSAAGGRVAPGVYRIVVPMRDGARLGSSVVVL